MNSNSINIINIITQVCDEFLDIVPPKIIWVEEYLGTETTLAKAYPELNTIKIRSDVRPSVDLLFILLHELRHIWQYSFNKAYYFNDYLTSDVLSTKAYNLQIAELDANAFSSLMMKYFVGVKPTFPRLDSTIRNAILYYQEELSFVYN